MASSKLPHTHPHTTRTRYTHPHTHHAHTNLVFGRGAAAVLGQVQHGSVALKAGRAVEAVLMNPTTARAHTQAHTQTQIRHKHT